MFLVGIGLMCVCLAVGLLLGGDPLFFVDIQSLVYVVGGTLGFIIATQSKRTFVAFVKAGMAQNIEPELKPEVIQLCLRSGRVAIGMGILGQLIGLVNMMANLSEPSSIGPAMAVSILSVLYGIFLSEVVFHPVATRLEFQEDKVVQAASGAALRGNLVLAMIVVLLELVTFLILLLSFSEFRIQ